MTFVLQPVRFLGRSVIAFFGYFGELTRLAMETFASVLTKRPRLKILGEQLVSIGLGSQTVIIVTGAFTGAVFAAQMFFAFNDFGMGTTVGAVTSISICRELGPVLTGLMLSGRVGAAMAALIGTMKVTDQVDALRVMGVHPVEYLVAPRFLGMMISMPILLAEAIGIALLASHIIAVYLFHVPSAWYGHQTWINTNPVDFLIAFIKGTVFGMIIVFVSCHHGFKTKNGTSGVGKATTTAMVSSSLLIVISNLFLTLILNKFFPLKMLSL